MKDLIERLEALTGPCRETDSLIAKNLSPELDWVAFEENGVDIWWSRCPYEEGAFDGPKNYTGSIDAAMSLVPDDYAVLSIRETTENEQEEYTGEERLPLWSVTLVRRDCTGYKNRKKFAVAFKHGDAATPAIALCIASLRSMGDK